jgi:branched-chain amino acid aminotransferase
MLKITKCNPLPGVKYTPNPRFGTVFAPHVLRMELKLGGQKEYLAEIIPYGPEPMFPGTSVLHYGQSIFEGMKAFRQKDGSIGIFRPDLHATRFRLSAQRMSMAQLPEEIFLQCLKEFVKFESESVPSEPEHSLYLRPLLIARDNVIKVGTAQTYTFYIMATIAGNYFGTGGVKLARVMVNRQFVRAYPGGLGEAKTASNYAASIWPQQLAAMRECDQVLYLDAVKHDMVDELGGMNFFFIRGKQLVTPALNGCILNGVTRRSVLEIAPQLGLEPIEETVSFTQLMKDIQAGTVTESFACGTAAVISPIGEFLFGEAVNDEPKPIKLNGPPTKSLLLLERLRAAQTGVNSPAGWVVKV